MPRKARVVLPDHPHHIVQRGHNRQAVFVSAEDYAYYLDNLRLWKERLGIKVYAYCLMTNHVHLVVDPGATPSHLALLMKRLAGRQTRYVNKLEGRTGTLWEGRYKSSPIQAETYLLCCCRHVERNPVRAGMVARPEEYPWSSFRAKIEAAMGWLDLDPVFAALGTTMAEQVQMYRAFVNAAPPTGEWDFMRRTVQRGQLTGTRRFRDDVAHRIGRRLEWRGRGRPDRSTSQEPRK